MAGKGRRGGFHPIYLLLAIPYLALWAVPFYDRVDPELAGIPFFYWYQMAWIFGGTAVILPVYLFEERRRK